MRLHGLGVYAQGFLLFLNRLVDPAGAFEVRSATNVSHGAHVESGDCGAQWVVQRGDRRSVLLVPAELLPIPFVVAQCAIDQRERVMSSAIVGKQLDGPEVRGGGGRGIAPSRRHPTHTILGVGALGMRRADRLIDLATLLPFADGEQTPGELQLGGHVSRVHAQGVGQRQGCVLVTSLDRLHPPKVEAPPKRLGIELLSPPIAERGGIVLLVGVQDHAQRPGRLGICGLRLGRCIGLLKLLPNGRQKIAHLQPGQ